MSNKSKAKRVTTPNGRLRPGKLDGLILRYMRPHKKDLPLAASAVAKGIDRSFGAIANSPRAANGEGGGAAGQTETAGLRSGDGEIAMWDCLHRSGRRG
jgi:hypothetical protein